MGQDTKIPRTSRPGIFLGEHTMTLDSKGRVSVPSDFVRDKQGEVILFKPEHSPILVAYHASVLQAEETMALMCIFSRHVNVDSTNRIVLPPEFRSHIGLGDEASAKITFVGTGDNFHIMTPENWQAMRPRYVERLENLLRQEGQIWVP